MNEFMFPGKMCLTDFGVGNCAVRLINIINVIYFNTANCVFKKKWIQNYPKCKGKIWNICPELIFELGGLELFLRCNLNINKVPIKLSSFHKQFCLIWMSIFKHNFSPHKSMIWNNKNITLKISLYFIETGIITLLFI